MGEDKFTTLLRTMCMIANELHEGVFSIHRNRSGWEICMGSVHGGDSRCYGDECLENALISACTSGLTVMNEERR